MTKNVLTIGMLLALFMTSCNETPKQEKQEIDKAASGHSRLNSQNEEDLDLSDEEQPVYLPKNMNCRSNTLN